MPQLEINNEDILDCILKSTIGVISRRTTDAYATVAIGNAVKNLRSKYAVFNYVEVKYAGVIQDYEFFNVVEINPEINYQNPKEIADATNDLIRNISRAIGKEAGYFFIKEIKEDMPYTYESVLKDMGINFDTLQLEYLTNRKNTFKLYIKNSDVLKYVLKTIYGVLEQEESRNYAYKTMDELTTRLSTEYTILKFVTVNDMNVVRGVDSITIENEKLDSIESSKVGYVIQKVVQEINNELDEKGGSTFIKKIKDQLNTDYIYKLGDMGVNFDVIRLNQVLVVKHVFKALIDVLSESSTHGYAVLMINNVLKKYDPTFNFLKLIKINSQESSEGLNVVLVSSEIDSTRPSELGRGMQRILQNISSALGETAGEHFVERFKNCLGKAYILRIEEIGVNLHMMELRQNLTW